MIPTIRRHLLRLQKIKRSRHHPLIHHLHKHHHISKKTLFYVKEYGPKSNVPQTIFKESIRVLLLASVISSVGGLALEKIKILFVSIIPLVILLPTLNDMVGDYGTIIASRFSTMLHEGHLQRKWWLDSNLKLLFYQVLLISGFTTLFSTTASLFISHVAITELEVMLMVKVFVIAILDVMTLVTLLFAVSVLGGKYLFNKGKDPNNFLIPLTTSIADFGNMFVLAGLVILFF